MRVCDECLCLWFFGCCFFHCTLSSINKYFSCMFLRVNELVCVTCRAIKCRLLDFHMHIVYVHSGCLQLKYNSYVCIPGKAFSIGGDFLNSLTLNQLFEFRSGFLLLR